MAAGITVLEPRDGLFDFDLRGLISEYRGLLYFLVWRDLKVRYKQTAAGVLWIGLQPLLTTIVLSLVFGRFARMASDGVPYPVFACSALVTWHLFAQAARRSASSLVVDSALLSKIYFPRLMLPLGTILGSFVDFVISLVVLIPLLIWYRITPPATVIFAPLFVLLAAVAALAFGLWLAPLNARYRDVGHALPFLIQIGMLASPVAYSSSIVPDKWRPVYAINPMAGAIEGFRWSLLGTAPPDPLALALSVATVLLVGAAGLVYFVNVERTLADVI